VVDSHLEGSYLADLLSWGSLARALLSLVEKERENAASKANKVKERHALHLNLYSSGSGSELLRSAKQRKRDQRHSGTC
jgi:hypothetical protein